MKRKAQWKRFWSLSRHQAGGFTLVELIVVIAILGILAGAGTAGYAGYVKSANKNADKVLVGNIIRAIETGTNSTMFVNEDSIDFGMATRPVGFVVLNSTGAKVVTPGSTVKYVEGACEFESIEGVLVETTSTKNSNCYSDESGTITSVATGTIYYCSTHSPEPQIVEATGTYISDYNHSGTNENYYLYKGCKGHTWTKVETAYPSGAKRVSNQNALYLEKSGGLCELAYAQQNGIVTSKPVNENVTSGPIYEALQAAFGDVSGLKLTYNGWNSDEGQGYATLYPAASGMMDSVSKLAGTLADVSGMGSGAAVGLLQLERSYENSADLFGAVSDKFAAIYGAEKAKDVDAVTEIDAQAAWLNHWNNAAAYTDGKASFGYTENGTGGREHIYSMRRMYNESFASYLQANGVTSDSVLKKVKEYGAPPELGSGTLASMISGTLSVVGGKFPLVVNEHTVADALQGESQATITTCSNLCKKYVGSEASKANAMATYDFMINVSETSDLATNKNNGVYKSDKDDSTNFMNYYMQYVNEISTLYNKAQTMAGDGIIIMVFTENDIVSCDVSPSAANPRNG